MSCCGRGRSQFQTSHAHNSRQLDTSGRPFPAGAPRATVVFEYQGRARAVVVGPVSGVRYRFDGAGSRVEVDPRDRRGLLALGQLRQVT